MSEEVVTPPAWRVASASCKGSSHGAEAPNQDAVQFAAVTDAAGHDVWVAAVSDGHGGRRYVRSDVGSALAVGVSVTHLADAVRHRDEAVGYDDFLRSEVPAVVAQWRDSVLDHLGAHPFSAAEEARAGEPLQDEPFVSYGATLLVVVVGEGGVGLAQIGDGDALIRTHGFATRPVPSDPRLVAGETTSLCLDSAVADFRYAALPSTADPDLVLLASDGYGNSFADKDWWRVVVGDLAWFLTDHGFDDFASQFPGWLGESALVGGDDVSAVVIARSPLVVAPAEVVGSVVARPVRSRPNPDVHVVDPVAVPVVAAVEAPVAAAPVAAVPAVPRTLLDPAVHDVAGVTDPPDPQPPGPAAQRPRSRRRVVAVALLLVVAVLAVATAVVWLIVGGSNEPDAPPLTPPPTGSPTQLDTGPGGAGDDGNQHPPGGTGDQPDQPRKHEGGVSGENGTGPAGQAGDG